MVKRYSLYQKFVQVGSVRTTKSVGVVEDPENGEYIKFSDHVAILNEVIKDNNIKVEGEKSD